MSKESYVSAPFSAGIVLGCLVAVAAFSAASAADAVLPGVECSIRSLSGGGVVAEGETGPDGKWTSTTLQPGTYEPRCQKMRFSNRDATGFALIHFDIMGPNGLEGRQNANVFLDNGQRGPLGPEYTVPEGRTGLVGITLYEHAE